MNINQKITDILTEKRMKDNGYFKIIRKDFRSNVLKNL